MKHIENSITKSFTIGHAKRTLEDICSNIEIKLPITVGAWRRSGFKNVNFRIVQNLINKQKLEI